MLTSITPISVMFVQPSPGIIYDTHVPVFGEQKLIFYT